MNAVEETSQLSGASSAASSLSSRVRTAIAMLAVVLAILSCTYQWPLYLLMTVLSIFSAIELHKLMGKPSSLTFVLTLLGFVVSVVSLTKEVSFRIVPIITLAASLVGVGAIAMRLKRGEFSWLDALSVGWLAGPIACSAWLHQATISPDKVFSPNLLFLVAAPLWIGDTAAYFVGKKYGRVKLAPTISPKKTVEGSVANFFFCILGALVIAMSMNLPMVAGLGVGVVTGIFGQAGDLFQSMMKRMNDIKDSGSILPGHGGVLDRIDSFLMSALHSVAHTMAAMTNLPEALNHAAKIITHLFDSELTFISVPL
ncbi:MAG: phosphatidate cytidylyltransferase, partial [Armatimonadetes bacterium]|nr:phosphatidate cytidylyltransferase [Armatimonadota bacterium]